MIPGRLEINEVSPTTAWGYFLERNVQVMEKGKGIRQNPANSLSWGDGDEGLEDKMARIRRTEHRWGNSCPERKFQWSAEAGSPWLSMRALLSSRMEGNYSRPGKEPVERIRGKRTQNLNRARNSACLPSPPPPPVRLEILLIHRTSGRTLRRVLPQ